MPENISWKDKKSSSLLTKLGKPNKEGNGGDGSFAGDFPDEVYAVFAGYLLLNPKNDKNSTRARLYTSLDMNEYVEFERSDVLYMLEPTANPPDDTKPVIVWLSNYAPVTHSVRTSDENITTQEGFLAGDIVNTYLSQSTQDLPTTSIARRRLLQSIYQPCSWGGCGSVKLPCGEGLKTPVPG